MAAEARPRIVLASGSSSRRTLLAAAGVVFETRPAEVDEEAIRQALRVNVPDSTPAQVADVLARAKAEAVSGVLPEDLIIGADQILALDGAIFSKPADMDAARRTLIALSGRTHQLHSAVVLAQGSKTVWSFTDTAHLTMRALTSAQIGRYLAEAGSRVLSSVGAYQLESLGIQLFERIEGDYFTILGMPMLPLLAALRDRRAIEA